MQFLFIGDKYGERRANSFTDRGKRVEEDQRKYQKKAAKEREKVNDVYVMVCGEKCYTEAEINDWYASDYITCEQSDNYIEKLNQKKARAGQTDMLTRSERVCRILDSAVNNLDLEIRDIKIREEQEQKKQERFKIAQAQGCSYQEFLELEEISRQSEEYEKRFWSLKKGCPYQELLTLEELEKFKKQLDDWR